jgi:phage gpG-like protein
VAVTDPTPVRIEVRADQARALLNVYAKRAGNSEVPNRQIAAQIQRHVLRQFDTGGRAYPVRGNPWPRTPTGDLAPRTWAHRQKIKKTGPPLSVTGWLKQSYLPFSSRTEAGIRSRVTAYATFHETGGKHLPQRSVLPTDEQALDYAVQIYNHFLSTGQASAGGAA